MVANNTVPVYTWLYTVHNEICSRQCVINGIVLYYVSLNKLCTIIFYPIISVCYHLIPLTPLIQPHHIKVVFLCSNTVLRRVHNSSWELSTHNRTDICKDGCLSQINLTKAFMLWQEPEYFFRKQARFFFSFKCRAWFYFKRTHGRTFKKWQ